MTVPQIGSDPGEAATASSVGAFGLVVLSCRAEEFGEIDARDPEREGSSKIACRNAFLRILRTSPPHQEHAVIIIGLRKIGVGFDISAQIRHSGFEAASLIAQEFRCRRTAKRCRSSHAHGPRLIAKQLAQNVQPLPRRAGRPRRFRFASA